MSVAGGMSRIYYVDDHVLIFEGTCTSNVIMALITGKRERDRITTLLTILFINRTQHVAVAHCRVIATST